MKKKLLALLSIAILVLELLPSGAVLVFASDVGEYLFQYYPYFSPIPFGYANFGPLITAILSCVLLVLAVLFLKKNRGKLCRWLRIVTVFAVLASLCPLILGAPYVTVPGLAITLLLITEFILSTLIIRKEF